jgi:hypothetical protein
VAKTLTKVDKFRDSVELVKTIGLFYDRNGSLMTSLMYSMKKDGRVQLNVYPGLARLGPLQPGFTFFITQDLDALFGMTLGNVPAVPFGLGSRMGD